MASNGLKSYDAATPGNNVLANTGFTMDESMAPSAVNDSVRQIMSDVRAALAYKGADIASAATTDLGAVAGLMHDITGSTTITSFGTVSAGIWKIIKFEGALTLTHNATSLILPNGVNKVTANGDIAIFISEGSGNWRCVSYEHVAHPFGGTYTPTLTNVTNVAASTVGLCQYIRVGAVVHVSGRLTIDPTAAAATQLDISIPVASNFGASADLAGVANCTLVAAQNGIVEAETTNDRAALKFTATDTANREWYFTFTYSII